MQWSSCVITCLCLYHPEVNSSHSNRRKSHQHFPLASASGTTERRLSPWILSHATAGSLLELTSTSVELPQQVDELNWSRLQESWSTAMKSTKSKPLHGYTNAGETLWGFELGWRGQVSSRGKAGGVISANVNYLWNHRWNFSTNNVRRTVEIQLNSVTVVETLPR